MSELVVLRQFGTEAEAQLAAAVLEANGIAARVVADNAGGTLPSMAILFPIRLVVRAEDESDARELLDTPLDDDPRNGPMDEESPWLDPEHVWHTAELETHERIALQQQEIAALDRAITSMLARPEEPLQFLRVEGWTTGEILAYMIARGLDETQVREGARARS